MYNTLRNNIISNIYPNQSRAISGQTLQDQLINIVNALDLGGLFLGFADKNTNPNTAQSSQANGFYFTTEEGTYTNFKDENNNSLVIGSNLEVIYRTLINDNSVWNHEVILNNGKSAYQIAVDEGFEGTEEEWLASLKGDKGDPGTDAVNPFKGWFDSSSDLTTAYPTAENGDYAYVYNASATPDPITTIWKWDDTLSTPAWTDTNVEVDTTNVQTFADGQEVSEVHIINDLTTGGADDVLSAEQGKVLNRNSDKESTAALLAKQLIVQDRPYYFNEDYFDASITSYEEISYLDKKINEVPAGKHFIFSTDSHVDYGSGSSYSNGSFFLKKETIIMKYVKDRLRIPNVIFGGDAIGGVSSKYKAAKILSVYCNENFNAFGGDFIFVTGNHDANYPIPRDFYDTTALISSREIYERTTKKMAMYGRVVFDTAMINAIDLLTLSDFQADNANANDLAYEKDELSCWAMQHYYYDDDKQKIRYIVLETIDMSYSCGVYISNDVSKGGHVEIPFLANAMLSVPSGYDIVVVGHQINEYNTTNTQQYSSANNYVPFYNLFYSVIDAYKEKKSISLYLRKGSVKNLQKTLYTNMGVDGLLTYDFSQSKGSGRILVISGHEHYDHASIVSPVTKSNQTIWQDDQHPITLYDDSILKIRFDRNCLFQKASDVPTGGTSYPNHGTGTGEEVRVGTVNECLFDVITITDDNRVICTRFGGGSNREFVLPVFPAV